MKGVFNFIKKNSMENIYQYKLNSFESLPKTILVIIFSYSKNFEKLISYKRY